MLKKKKNAIDWFLVIAPIVYLILCFNVAVAYKKALELNTVKEEKTYIKRTLYGYDVNYDDSNVDLFYELNNNKYYGFSKSKAIEYTGTIVDNNIIEYGNLLNKLYEIYKDTNIGAVGWSDSYKTWRPCPHPIQDLKEAYDKGYKYLIEVSIPHNKAKAEKQKEINSIVYGK